VIGEVRNGSPHGCGIDGGLVALWLSTIQSMEACHL